MQTECSADRFGFAPVERRAVVAGFDGGRMTSDAGALLLGATDRAIGLVKRFAECFADSRVTELIEHEVGLRVEGHGRQPTEAGPDAGGEDKLRTNVTNLS